MTNDILAQVRVLKESGELAEMAKFKVAKNESLLARFALMILEQQNKPDDHVWVKCSVCGYIGNQHFDYNGFCCGKILERCDPPVPAPDNVEARAERAADKIMGITDVEFDEFDTKDELVKVIVAAIKGK